MDGGSRFLHSIAVVVVITDAAWRWLKLSAIFRFRYGLQTALAHTTSAVCVYCFSATPAATRSVQRSPRRKVTGAAVSPAAGRSRVSHPSAATTRTTYFTAAKITVPAAAGLSSRRPTAPGVPEGIPANERGSPSSLSAPTTNYRCNGQWQKWSQ